MDFHGQLKNEKANREKSAHSNKQRIAYIEKMLGDSADKHDKHLQAFASLHQSLQEYDGRHKKLSDQFGGEKQQREAHHASVQQRIDYLEKCMGDSADKHRELENSHRMLHDAHGRTAKELDGAHKKVQDLHASHDDHKTLPQRIQYIEKLLGDSADKHDKHLKEFDAVNKAMKELHSSHTNDKKTRDGHHATVGQRLDFLEKSLGDSADKHKELDAATKLLQDKHGHSQNELDAAHRKLHESHSSMQSRVAYLEKLCGDSSEKHDRHLQEQERIAKQLQDVHGRVNEAHLQVTGEKKARDANHATLQQRMDYVEKMLGDSADKHKALEAAHRMHQDTHGQTKSEVDQAHKKLQDMHSRLQEHATVPQRISYLEKLLGDSQDKHDKHINDLEALNKHFHDLKSRVGGIDNHLQGEKSTRDSHHASFQQRLEFIEKSIGDSADKHREIEQAHKLLHDKHGHSKNELDAATKTLHDSHATMKQRVSYLEKVCNDSADKHNKHIQDLEKCLKNVQDVGDRFNEIHGLFHGDKKSKDSMHATQLQRIEYLEKCMGDSADKHKELETLQKIMHDSHGNHKNEFEAAQKRIQDIHGRLQDHATVPQRLQYLEKLLGDSADKHDKHVRDFETLRKTLQDVKGRLEDHGNSLSSEKATRDSHHATLAQRMDYIEKALGDSADKHRDLEDLHKKLHDNHGSHKNEADVYRKRLETSHASMQQRVDFLEQAVGDSADKHAKELLAAHSQLKELHGRVADAHGQIKDRDQHHATVQQRIEYLEKAFGDSRDLHDKHVREIEGLHARHKDVDSNHANEKRAREEHHASIGQRLDFVEQYIGDSIDKHNQALEDAHKKLHDFHGKVEGHKKERDEFHATLEQRVKYLEACLNETADKFINKADLEEHVRRLEGNQGEHREWAEGRHLTFEKRVDILEQLMGMVDKKLCASTDKELEEMEKAAREQEEISERLKDIAKPLDMDAASGSQTPVRMPSRQTPYKSTSSGYSGTGGLGGGPGFASPRLTPGQSRGMSPRMSPSTSAANIWGNYGA
jgi:chromosome segregation ATPase